MAGGTGRHEAGRSRGVGAGAETAGKAVVSPPWNRSSARTGRRSGGEGDGVMEEEAGGWGR